MNLLGNVLARQAASEAGAYEAILHEDGIVTEGAATNVLRGARWRAAHAPADSAHPPRHHAQGGHGTPAELGLPVKEEPIPLPTGRGEEIFICGSTTDVTPVVTLDGKPVGTASRAR